MDSVAPPDPLVLDPTALGRPADRPAPRGRSVVVAALLGWAVPGLGHAYVGQPLKALLFFAAIVPTFALGLALTDYTCVNPQKYTLEFVAHAWAGGPTAAAVHLTKDRFLTSMPRWFDVGRLYAAVAGLLNVVALSDVVGAVLRRNRVVERRRRRRERGRPGAWVEMLPPELVTSEVLEAPALPELDGRESLFSAVEGLAGADAEPAPPPAFPAIPGDTVLEDEGAPDEPPGADPGRR